MLPGAAVSPRMSPAGGVAIGGVDLSRPLGPALKVVIDDALLAHHVVAFPGQSLSREQQFAFAAQFGEVEPHGVHRGESKRYDIAHVMTNLGADGRPAIRRSPAANYHWHTDKPYHRAPPSLTMLHAVEVPPYGGDTEFANAVLAYDALSPQIKRYINRIRVLFAPAFEDPSRRATVDHPLVRTHPLTGRKSLYLGNHAIGIAGWPESDGRALLAELLAHVTQRQFVHVHRWRRGDLVMWDNRCLLHRVVADDGYAMFRRIMYRSVVAGAVPI